TSVLSSAFRVPAKAVIRLDLVESDLKSLRIALQDYRAAKARAWDDPAQRDRLFHHAKVFIVCMWRFARMLEAIQSAKQGYPKEVQDAISLTWKATKPLLDAYRIARDAIEHIDGEVTGSNSFTNLYGDELEVTD